VDRSASPLHGSSALGGFSAAGILALDMNWHKCSNSNKRTGRVVTASLGGNEVMLVIVIAVVLCSAYLLWQIWEADLVD